MVVAIIAILGAALIPSLRRSLIMARNTVCMHNIHMIGQSLAQYRYDNDGWLPTDGAPPPAADSEWGEVWFVKLYPSYLPDPVVLTCPEDPYRSRMARVRDIRTERDVANFASYGINSFIVASGSGFLADLDRRWPTRPLDIILAADMGPDRVDNPNQPNDPGGSVPDRNAGLLAWDDGYDPVMPDEMVTPWVTNRHGGTINMLTIDGSVRRPRVNRALTAPIQRYYEDCAAGGCTLCRDLHLYHYSFAQDRLYWWTGPAPVE